MIYDISSDTIQECEVMSKKNTMSSNENVEKFWKHKKNFDAIFMKFVLFWKLMQKF